MTVLNPGDIHEIVIRGTWNGDEPITLTELAALVLADDFVTDESDTVTVAKVAPPVVQFVAGDVVRSKSNGRVVAIDHDGYTVLSGFEAGKRYVFGGGGIRRSKFTSEFHEKIELD